MIYVRIEVWPLGDRKQARVIGEAEIENVGGNAEYGEYQARVYEEGEPCTHRRVRRHPRASGAWALLRRVLAVMP